MQGSCILSKTIYTFTAGINYKVFEFPCLQLTVKLWPTVKVEPGSITHMGLVYVAKR